MVVEALFWFHPLVWWLGARLVEERERACDEEVLELGGERQIYAESILKVCEFCVGSPLACVAGVTGSDLKKRIVHIMTKNVVRKLDFSRKLLLSVSGLVAVALPVGFGLMHATPGRAASASENVGSYKYQVTSLKPSKISPDGVIRQKMLFKPEGMSVEGVTPGELVREAYELGDNQISGAPDWVNSTRFDIEASADKATADELMKLNQDQQALATRRMRQALIADAFKLAVHAESKNLQQYTLVVANGGAKLQVAKIGEGDEDAPSKPGELQHLRMMRSGPGELTGQGLRTTEIASLLSRQLGATVTDQTGLKGIYEINLHWIATEGELPMDNAQHLFPPEAKVFSPAGSQPSLSTALQEQLGLELKSQIGPVLVIAIDHVERPGAN
jgi:uncharacterized protein (TIGR03435 family)